MPTMSGLGLTESCRLARDIGYQTNGKRDLPRFEALDEVKPVDIKICWVERCNPLGPPVAC
jgi:hypothetical protein